MTPRIILAFDTSGAHVTAGLWGASGEPCFEEMARGQAERLIPMCEEVLSESGHTWADLDAVGVGVGPGNFTGIRISVSAARGLALSLGIPAVGVTGFEWLHQGYGWSGRVMISLPAPREQAYVQTFSGGRPLGPAVVTRPGVRDAALEQPNLLVVGYQAAEIAKAYGAQWDSDVWKDRHPEMMASNIGLIAANKIEAMGGSWDEAPTPLYIRPADAAPPREAPPVIQP